MRELSSCMGPTVDNCRVIELPAGYDLSQAKAAYQNGFLRIDVPQGEIAQAKRVSIYSGKSK